MFHFFMKTRFHIFALLFFAILSCDEGKPPQNEPIPEILFKEIIVSHEDCLPDSIGCTFVQIEYPAFTDSTKFVLNELISSKIKASASTYFSEEVIRGTLEHVVHSFVRDYETFKRDYPDYKIGWYVKIFCVIIYESETVLSFQIDSESFTGGAHPNSGTQYHIVDKKNNSEMTMGEVISDTTKFKQMLEEKFRQIKGMGADQSFADLGYWINDGDFLLNENIGISDHTVIMHYNPYEIAPYSLGATTVEINKSELAGILKID